MGQLGFFNRTLYNLRVLKIIGKNDNDEIFDKMKKKPFKNYGILKSNYIIIKGSLTGPAKRMIRMRKAIRKIKGEYDRNIIIKNID